MSDIITEIMVEVLRIFGIATKELRRGSASEFRIDYLWMLTEGYVEKMMRKLAGMDNLESALKKLDRLTQEEARMALAEVLRLTHSVRDEVNVVDGKVESVGDGVKDIRDKVEDIGDEMSGIGEQVEVMSDKMADIGDQVEDIGGQVKDIDDQLVDIGDQVEDIDDRVEDIGDQLESLGDRLEDLGDMVEDIGDKLQCVDESVQVIINGARVMSTQSPIRSNI